MMAVAWGLWRFLGDARRDLAAQGFDWREIRFGWLVTAAVIYALGLLPACWFWKRVLCALQQQPSWLMVARAYFVGGLGKYVPGKALVVVMRAALVRGPRVDTTVAALSVFIETLTMMAVGACMAALVVLFQVRDWRLLVLAVGLMLGAGVPTWPPLFRWIVKQLRVKRANPMIEELLGGVDARVMVSGWVSMAVGWIFLGLSLGAVMMAIPQAALDGASFIADLPIYTACVSLAMVAGFLSLLPGGVGVRELVVMSLLAAHPRYGPLVAMVSAVLLRLSWMVSEVAVSAILYLGGRTDTTLRSEPLPGSVEQGRPQVS